MTQEKAIVGPDGPILITGATGFIDVKVVENLLERGFRHLRWLYGPKNGLMLDDDQEMLIKLRGQKYKSCVEKFLPLVTLSRQCFPNLKGNVQKFPCRDFHVSAGCITSLNRFIVRSAIRRQFPFLIGRFC